MVFSLNFIFFKKPDGCREKSKLNWKFNWKNKNIAKITCAIMDFLNEFYFQSKQQANRDNMKMLKDALLGLLTGNE